MYGEDDQHFWLDGQPKPDSESDMNWMLDYIVEPDYFKVMGIPLESGRDFTEQDDNHSPFVVVVDHVLAQKYFPGQDPVGKRVNLATFNAKAEIVGVVGHVNQWGLDSDANNSLRSEMYLPIRQMPDDWFAGTSGTSVVARATGEPDAVLASIRRTVHDMSAEDVVYGFEPMNAIISDSLADRRFSMILLGAFATLALLLASVGIYGVMSYFVGQRTQEIGIRVALGAQRSNVLRLVLGDGVRMTLVGVAAGLIAALGLTRILARYSLLFGVSATDPLTLLAVALLLTIVALTACYIPARRALRVDPVVALRYE